VRVGFSQFAPRYRDKSANCATVARALSNVSADLIVLPELFSTGYCFASVAELAEYAENPDTGATFEFLADLSRRTGTTLVAGLAEQAQDGIYNSSVIQVPGSRPAIYRKIHLFDREKVYFRAGDREPAVIHVPGADVGTQVCFDYFFPELSRVLALTGAQIICHPANLVLPYAQTITLARAMENRVFWILCNRVGTETQDGRSLTFTGMSQVVAPDGTVLCRAGPDTEELRIVDIEPAQARNKVVGNNDLFRDRRPRLYGRLTRP
jgi:predicted amidohydrolase